MDYGQLAYIKAEELERYLLKAERSDRHGSEFAAFYPRTAAESEYAPCALSGSGAVSLVVYLRLSAPKTVSGIKVWLYCGSKPVTYTVVSLSGGLSGRYTLLGVVYPDADALTVRADTAGLIIEEMQVLASGNGVHIIGGQQGYKCDGCDGEVYMAREENGYLYVSRCGTDTKVNVTHGGVFDLSVTADAVSVLCGDDTGNLWGVTYDRELNETARLALGEAPDRVALGRNRYGMLIAALKNGALMFARCDDGFLGMSQWTPADFTVTADNVYFAKQTDTPALFLCRGNEIFAKLPTPSLGANDCLRVHVAMEIL